MDIIQLTEQYGIAWVLLGLLATIICGFIKLPIIKYLKKLTNGDGVALYTEKQISDKVRSWCTLIVALISTAGVIIFYSVQHIYNWAVISADILVSVSCSKLMYMMYEGQYKAGNGKFSIKTWVHKLWEYVKEKFKNKLPQELVDIIQRVLTEQVHLPLTDTQKALFVSVLTEILKNKKDPQ